jgi:hypothetical protein
MSSKTVRDAERLNKKVQGTADDFRKPQRIPYGDPANDETSLSKTKGPDSFPAQYFKHDEKQRKINIAQQYAKKLVDSFAAGGNAHPSVSYQPSKEEINLVLRRENELQVAAFEKFIRDRFNANDPHDQRLIKELWPAYFDKRMEAVEHHLDLQRRIARIKLMGITSTEDLMFLYALATQDVAIPTTTAFNLGDDDTETFQRGQLNPRRITGIPAEGVSFWRGVNSNNDRIRELFRGGSIRGPYQTQALGGLGFVGNQTMRNLMAPISAGPERRTGIWEADPLGP